MVIMEGQQDDSSADSALRQRKFGLPDWMVNNIERLNFATDFEQYACSPPETESFLTDLKDSIEIPEISHPFPLPIDVKEDVNIKNIPKAEVQSDVNSPKLIIDPPNQLPVLHQALSILKNEELSSPDSTPCVTPEPSPIIRRKMSNPSDTVITNPGRWFYVGKINKPKKNSRERLSEFRNKENNAKFEDKPSDIYTSSRDSILNAKKNGIKLMISNFDLNAVGPTSW